MIIYILINIAIVLLILGFDLYRHRFRQLKFSSILSVSYTHLTLPTILRV